MSVDSVVLDDKELQRIYTWVDEIPLSRPKRNITRDFSDGVLLAEVVHHYYPKLVEIHNYSGANSVRQKMYNWATLNQKVFRRLGFLLEKQDIDAIVACKPGAVEMLLMRLQKHLAHMRRTATSPAAAGPGDGPSGSMPALMDGSAAYEGVGSSSSTSVGRGNNHGGGVVGGGGASASSSNGGGGGGGGSSGDAVDAAIIAEKDATIADLRETVEILELKIKKLEQLVRLKDSRIQTLTARLGASVPSAPTM